jgi:hypothetical protein
MHGALVKRAKFEKKMKKIQIRMVLLDEKEVKT